MNQEKSSYSKLRSQALLAKVKNLQQSVSNRTSQQVPSHSFQKYPKNPKRQVVDISNISSLSISSSISLNDLKDDFSSLDLAGLDKKQTSVKHSLSKNSLESLNSTSFGNRRNNKHSDDIEPFQSLKNVESIRKAENQLNNTSTSFKSESKSHKIIELAVESPPSEDILEVLSHSDNFSEKDFDESIKEQAFIHSYNSSNDTLPYKVVNKSLPNSYSIDKVSSSSNESIIPDMVPSSSSQLNLLEINDIAKSSKSDIFRVFSPNLLSSKSSQATLHSPPHKSGDSSELLQKETSLNFESNSYEEDFVNSSHATNSSYAENQVLPTSRKQLGLASNHINVPSFPNKEFENKASILANDDVQTSLRYSSSETPSKDNDISQSILEKKEVSQHLDSSSVLTDIPFDISADQYSNSSYSKRKDDISLSHFQNNSTKFKDEQPYHLVQHEAINNPNKSKPSLEHVTSSPLVSELQNQENILEPTFSGIQQQKQSKVTQTEFQETLSGFHFDFDRPPYRGSLDPPGGDVRGSLKKKLIQEVHSLDQWVAMRRKVHAAFLASLPPNYHYTTTKTLKKELKQKKKSK